MEILLLTTKSDKSRKRIAEEAEKRGFGVSMWFYENIDITKIKKEDLSAFGFLILRDPYNTGRDFSHILKAILNMAEPSKVLDYSTYRKYPSYEDKLFQHTLFNDIVKMSKFWKYDSLDEVSLPEFPVVLKKRIGSRGKGIFVMNSMEEIRDFFRSRNINDYFFEEQLNIKKDIRVIVIGNEIIGSVERKPRLKENSGYIGIGVKVTGRCEIPEEMRAKSTEISRRIESDFCGIDFVVDENGQHYLLECNISPQFVSFERVSGINVAGKLIDFILRKKRKI